MKRTLTLIRHAKSSHDDPTLRDFSRPLNPRGQADAPRIGHHLAHHLLWSPDLILCSTATRTLHTARLLTQGMGDPHHFIQHEPRIYEATVPTLLEIIQETPDSLPHLALIGHNPGLEHLANWLLGTHPLPSLVTCAVLILQLHTPTWSPLTPGCAQLQHHLEPRSLPSE